jgi:hypothetical protein
MTHLITEIICDKEHVMDNHVAPNVLNELVWSNIPFVVTYPTNNTVRITTTIDISKIVEKCKRS